MSGLEVIGGAAAITQLAGYLAQAYDYLTELESRTRKQSDILEQLSCQAECIIDAAKSITSDPSQDSSALRLIRKCLATAVTLHALVEKWQSEIPNEGKRSMRSKIIATTTWRSKEKEMAPLRKEIKEIMEIFHFRALINIECNDRNSGHTLLSVVAKRGPVLSDFVKPRIEMYSAGYSSAMWSLMESTLPPRNGEFVGRESSIHELKQMRKYGNRIAVMGLGGTGKTQLAIEFTIRVRKELQGTCIILFVSAESELQAEQSLSKIAVDAELATSEVSYSLKCEAVKNFFESDPAVKWQIIVDGADDREVFFGPKRLIKYLPRSTSGCIIFTTRNLQLALDYVDNEETVFSLDGFSLDDGIALLKSRLGPSKHDLNGMRELVKLLEGLPLALSQAASFIATTCGSVQEYNRLYREDETTRIGLLGYGRSNKDGSIMNPVSKTWQISFERIKRDDNFAAHLLCFAACLHYCYIPICLLPEHNNELKITVALSILRAHCLITSNSIEKTFSMHSLVHLAIRHWLKTENQFEEYAQLAFNSIYDRFPVEFQHQDQLTYGESCSIHIQPVLNNLTCSGRERSYADLASRFSAFSRINGDYNEALQYAQLAVNLTEKWCGQQQPHTLTMQNSLAVVLWYLGRLQDAETLAREVLKLRQEILGQEDLDTLVSLNTLGLILNDKGDWVTAESYHRQAFETRKRVLGLKHDETMRSLNNLGISLKRQKRYEDAEQAFREVFMEREKSLGKTSIGGLLVMSNLGSVLQLQGKLDDALMYHEEVLYARISIHGSKHPNTLKSKQNVAIVKRRQGQVEEAESMTRKILNSYEEILGKENPTTLWAKSNLAITLKAQGRYGEAESTSQEVLEARKSKLREGHPDIVVSENQLRNIRELIKKKDRMDTNAVE